MQQGEDEAQVARDRRLPGEQHLDPLLDVQVRRVDLVVERDHLVGELGVLLPECVQRAAQRTEDELTLFLQRRLGAVERLLERDAHQPNRPVT